MTELHPVQERSSMGRQGPIPAKPAQGTADAQDPCASYKPDVGPSYCRSKHRRLAGVKRTFTAEQDTRHEIQGAAMTSGEKKKGKPHQNKNTQNKQHCASLPLWHQGCLWRLSPWQSQLSKTASQAVRHHEQQSDIISKLPGELPKKWGVTKTQRALI